MITNEDVAIIDSLRKYLDKRQENLGETMTWIFTLDKLVSNLKKAPESYRACTEEDIEERYYLAECDVCGWWGSSKLLDGGGAIADTGDHEDCVCPVCCSPEISEKDDFAKEISKRIAEEAWRMLPDNCKQAMEGLEKSYKESLAADIEHQIRKM